MSEPKQADDAILSDLGKIISDHMRKAYTPEILRGIVARQLWCEERRKAGEEYDGASIVRVITPRLLESGLLIAATLVVEYALPEHIERTGT